jgi:serine protease Do
VYPRSAAEKHGLSVGDVIRGIDGVPVRSAAVLEARIASKRPGDRIELEVSRARGDDEGRRNVTVALGRKL